MTETNKEPYSKEIPFPKYIPLDIIIRKEKHGKHAQWMDGIGEIWYLDDTMIEVIYYDYSFIRKMKGENWRVIR